MSKSKIEWTEETINPTMGCSIVSEGCKNCYAMRQAYRLASMGQKGYKGLTKKLPSGRIVWTGKINLDIDKLKRAVKKKEPTMFFVDSMSDLFHEDVPFEFIKKVYDIMMECNGTTGNLIIPIPKPYHIFQVLTKRIDRAKEFYEKYLSTDGRKRIDYMPNIWLGVSVEDQKTADERIPLLLQTPAAVRWISAEPLLGEIDLRKGNEDWLFGWKKLFNRKERQETVFNTNKLDWVVVGGESGPGARPMNPDWVGSLKDQCKSANIPFLFKQWGKWLPIGKTATSNRKAKYFDGQTFISVGKKKSGNLLDGKQYLEYPNAKKI